MTDLSSREQVYISKIYKILDEGPTTVSGIYRKGMNYGYFDRYDRNFIVILKKLLNHLMNDTSPNIKVSSDGVYDISDDAKSELFIQQNLQQEQEESKRTRSKRKGPTSSTNKQKTVKITNIKSVPIYNPNMDDMKDFNSYILKIYKEAVQYGGCRIVPPKGWSPNSSLPKTNYATRDAYDKLFGFSTKKIPVHFQEMTGSKGLYQVNPQKHQENITVDEYISKYGDGPTGTTSEIEQEFWNRIMADELNYSYDINDSFFEDENPWNINKLKNYLGLIPNPMDGVKTSYVYFGSFPSLFPWHCEDFNFFSTSYLHFGKEKQWYCVPSFAKSKFDEVIRELLPKEAKECIDFVKHKTTMIHPEILMEHGVPIYTSIQKPGEFMVTFPASYHSGFNHGINCAEAVNFALEPWLSFADDGLNCVCVNKRLNWQLNMEEFRKAIQKNEVSEKILVFDEEDNSSEDKDTFEMVY